MGMFVTYYAIHSLCPAAISIRNGFPHGEYLWNNMGADNTITKWNSLKKYNKRPYQFEMDKKFMRVVKLWDWPWKEIQQSRQNPPPFMVAGEVSIEKSKEFADLNPIETACGNLSSIEYNGWHDNKAVVAIYNRN